MKVWPGQVVLCVAQVYWTTEVHDALKNGPGGLKKYWDQLQEQLKSIVELVRGKLTKQQRITLGALVTIDVHARDVVLDMADKGLSNSITSDKSHYQYHCLLMTLLAPQKKKLIKLILLARGQLHNFIWAQNINNLSEKLFNFENHIKRKN